MYADDRSCIIDDSKQYTSSLIHTTLKILYSKIFLDGGIPTTIPSLHRIPPVLVIADRLWFIPKDRVTMAAAIAQVTPKLRMLAELVLEFHVRKKTKLLVFGY